MPVHPIHASYTHVITAGLKNAKRLQEEKCYDLLWNELDHLEKVNAILQDFLLYYPHDPRFSESEHLRYWAEVRPDYMCEAEPKSLWEHYTAWAFLAKATMDDEFYTKIDEEMDKLRDAYLTQS